MSAAVLSLGSNLGDRMAHLAGGLRVLRSRLPVLAVSAVYTTAPVGGPDQPDFLNAAVLVGAPADGPAPDPEDLLAAAWAAEQAEGRVRAERWGPRTLDVDVVFVPGVISPDPRLTLPHPRAHERAFVLAPWLELDPDAVLPGRGRVEVLLAGLADQAVSRVGELVAR